MTLDLASYQGQQEIKEAIQNLTITPDPQRALWYDNVANMRAADLPIGVTAATRGYYAVNDGGSAFYYVREIEAGDTDDGGSVIILDNGNVAECIISPMTTAMWGKHNGDAIDDILSKQVPIVLSFDHTFDIHTDCFQNPSDAYCLDNVTFDGHKLTNTGRHYRAAVYITKSKTDMHLQEVMLRIINTNNVNLSNFSLIKSDVSGGCVNIVNANKINISDFTIESVYVSGTITNTDGIYIGGDCHDINITNGYINTGDDSFGIVADDIDHLFDGDISNVTVSNITTGQTNYNFVNIQNETHSIENISFTNCVAQSAQAATCQLLYVGTQTTKIKNVLFDNCTLINNVTTSDPQTRIINVKGAKNVSFSNCVLIPSSIATFVTSFVESNNISLTDTVIESEKITNNFTLFGLENVDGFYVKNLTSLQTTYKGRFVVTNPASHMHIDGVNYGYYTTFAELYDTSDITIHNLKTTSTEPIIEIRTGSTTVDINAVQINNASLSRNVAVSSGAGVRSIQGCLFNNGNPTTIVAGDKWASIYGGNLSLRYGSSNGNYATISAS